MKKHKQESHIHHYIPQFILRNFCDDNYLEYWDIQYNQLSYAEPHDIFMNIDMNRDELNHKDDPTFIEKSLSKFENDVAPIFKRILVGKTIRLTRTELQQLRIYLTLQSFRDNHRKEQYVNNDFDDSTRAILLPYTKDGDFVDLWKRELEEICNCRSYEDIEKSKVLNPIIKMDFLNDLQGQFMTIIESRGQDFLIGDVYPTSESYYLTDKVGIHMHIIFPISPSRVLLLNSTMFDKKLKGDQYSELLRKRSKFNECTLRQPAVFRKNKISLSLEDVFEYKVVNLYKDDVVYINELTMNEARIGIAFKDKNKIIESIKSYCNRDDAKVNYSNLNNELNNQHVYSYYDESGHDRKLTIKSFTNEHHFNNFVSGILNINVDKIESFETDYLQFEEKYKKLYDVDELKSSQIKLKKYEYGLSSFKSIDLDLINDFFSLLDNNDVYVYICCVDKICYLVSQLFSDKTLGILNYKYFIYTISKIISKYDDKTVLEKICNHDVHILDYIKEYSKSLINKNGNNLNKQEENMALKILINVLDDVNCDADLDFDYSVSFDFFRSYLNDNNFFSEKLSLDKEGSGKTKYCALKIGLKHINEYDSQSCTGIRATDLIVGFISRFIQSLKNAYSYSNFAASNK